LCKFVHMSGPQNFQVSDEGGGRRSLGRQSFGQRGGLGEGDDFRACIEAQWAFPVSTFPNWIKADAMSITRCDVTLVMQR